MKNSIKIALAMIFFSAITAFAAEKTIKVQTNLHCESCKGKIEKQLKKTNGVLSSYADVESKIVTIKYDDSKIDSKKVSSTISELGYKAEVIENKPQPKKKIGNGACCDVKFNKSNPSAK